MFTYGIRNIVHKHAIEDISILYYPANDLIDDIITDWDANFFIYIDLLNNKINKNNVAYINDASLFEYDFILCYNITSDILDISTKLHIPIITYLRYGSYDDSKIPDQKNIYYIVEHHGQSEQEKLLAITPTINKNVINNDNNICLFINAVIPAINIATTERNKWPLNSSIWSKKVISFFSVESLSFG